MPYAEDSAAPAAATTDAEVAAPVGATPRAAGMLFPLRFRDYRLLFGGQLISVIGDAFYLVALPWLVLTTGGSAQSLSLVVASYGLPRVIGLPVGGWLSDRLRPRLVMLSADAVRALAAMLLAASAFTGHPRMWLLCALAGVLGACGGLFLPAASAIVPDILPDAALQAGNALGQVWQRLAMLVGPGIAGLVVAHVQSGPALAVDALTFVVSALALVAMRRKPDSGAEDGAEDALERTDAASARTDDGAPASFWALLRTSRLLQVGLLVLVGINLTAGGLWEVALPALAYGPMHAGAQGYGVLLTAFGAGALGGSVLAGASGHLPNRGTLLMLLELVYAGTLALVPFLGGVAGASAALVITGAANGAAFVFYFTLVQETFPRRLLGRIFGALMFATFGLDPLSALLAGAVTGHFGPAVLFPLSAVLVVAAATYGLLQPAIRAT